MISMSDRGEVALLDVDYLGAEGGRLALAFAAGCVGCWTFIKAFVSGPLNKANERRFTELKLDHERCQQRVAQLEAMMFVYGGAQMRDAMQSHFSPDHLAEIIATGMAKEVSGE